jgi:hypothetical protein
MPITEPSKQIARAPAPRKTRDYDEDSMEEGEVSDGDAGTHLASILIAAASVAPVAAVAPGPEPASARLHRAGRGSAAREPSAPSLVEGLPAAPPAAPPAAAAATPTASSPQRIDAEAEDEFDDMPISVNFKSVSGKFFSMVS